MEGVDIVFHAAALKHVPLCEYNPFEAVKTNVIGTQNVLRASIEQGVEKFILISTDKAVSPTSVMGATKLLAERITVASNFWKGSSPTVAAAVRFGNVVGTRGSIVPLFLRQAISKGEITITDPRMTRFLMNVSLAVSLVLKAAELAVGGEVFVLKMKSVEIGRLADMILSVSAERGLIDDPSRVNRRIIGLRPGEKMHEHLVGHEEISRLRDLGDLLVLLPERYADLPDIRSVVEERYLEYPPLNEDEYKYLSSETAPRFSDAELHDLIDMALNEMWGANMLEPMQ